MNNNDNGSSENKIPSKEAQYPSGGEPMSDVSMSKGSINESLSGSNPELLTMNLKISNINRNKSTADEGKFGQNQINSLFNMTN